MAIAAAADESLLSYAVKWKLYIQEALCQEEFIWSLTVYAWGPHRGGLKDSHLLVEKKKVKVG